MNINYAASVFRCLSRGNISAPADCPACNSALLPWRLSSTQHIPRRKRFSRAVYSWWNVRSYLLRVFPRRCQGVASFLCVINCNTVSRPSETSQQHCQGFHDLILVTWLPRLIWRVVGSHDFPRAVHVLVDLVRGMYDCAEVIQPETSFLRSVEYG